MSKALYAVNDRTIDIFKGSEQAFIHLVTTSCEEQKAVFIQHNDLSEYIDCCLVYFGEENIEIKQNLIIYHQPLFNQTFTLLVNKENIIVEDITHNPFFEVMIRVYQNWAEIDELGSVFWLGSCQKSIKRVE